MLRKISALLATLLCLGMMGACSQSENDTIVTSENTGETIAPNTEHYEDDTASDTTETSTDTTPVVPPETESDTQPADDTTESDTTTHSTPDTPTEDTEEIPADKIFLNPDGKEFAYKLQAYYNNFNEPIVQYWDTGEVLATFELHPDSGTGKIFKINGHAINCLYVSIIRQILVENEYIIIVLGGTDVNTDQIYIYDHDGNILFKTYYLSNSGMVNVGKLKITDNKIIIKGTRMTHGPSITLGINSSWWDDFLEYSDYLYEDTVYDYGDNFMLPYEVYLDDSNIDEIKLLNPNEKTDAVFEMEYLGNEKFSKLNMVSYRTLGDFYSYWD